MLSEKDIKMFTPKVASNNDFDICVFNYEKLPETTKRFLNNFFKETSKKETLQIRR